MDIEAQQIPRHHIDATGVVYLILAEHSQAGNVVRGAKAPGMRPSRVPRHCCSWSFFSVLIGERCSEPMHQRAARNLTRLEGREPITPAAGIDELHLVEVIAVLTENLIRAEIADAMG